jgi:hypothetical protein
MAKPNNTSTIVDWIWLHDALVRATETFGSVVLAKDRVTGWMANGQLPWDCMSFEGPDADRIATLREDEKKSIVGYILPSAAYHKGDPAFWRADPNIWWNENENAAREKSMFGARALGIKVSSTHLDALLPGEPRDGEKVGPQMRRVLQVLKTCYPPDGKVPDDISTEVVRGRVNEELSDDSRNRELAAPSWDTVNRALGRG